MQACFVFAQDSTFTKAETKLYGSPKEKAEQVALRQKAGYELYRLIGFKEYYANGIASFLQMNGYNLDDTKAAGNQTTFVFTPRVGMGKPPKLYFKYWVNTDKRITKVQLSGYPDALAKLFVFYWPTDAQWANVAQLKKGTVAKKMLIDEAITYNSKGGAPFIEVSKL